MRPVSPRTVPADQSGPWSATVEVASYLRPHPEDFRTPHNHQPLTELSFNRALVLGVGRDEVLCEQLAVSGGSAHSNYVLVRETWALTSNKPFIVVHLREFDQMRGDELARQYRRLQSAKRLDPSNQYGQTPLAQPLSSRLSLLQQGEKMLSWVRLSDLVERTGLEAAELIRRFARFSPSSFFLPNVPVLRHEGNLLDPLAPATQEDVIRIYPEGVPQDFCGGEISWSYGVRTLDETCEAAINRAPSSFWIPEQLAVDVALLAQFDALSEEYRSAAWFRLTAATPTQPKRPLPVLSAGQLRELRTQRTEQDKELG